MRNTKFVLDDIGKRIEEIESRKSDVDVLESAAREIHNLCLRIKELDTYTDALEESSEHLNKSIEILIGNWLHDKTSAKDAIHGIAELIDYDI